MKLTPTIAAATLGVAALSSAFLVTGSATAGQQDRATGGGQILVGAKGAGDTVAFTAQGTAEAAKGQVQYVDRTDGTGQGQVVKHGTVDCIDADGDVARISGLWRAVEGGEPERFYLYVLDNGEGAAAGNDIVAFTQEADGECADEPAEENMTALGRGNAQVRDAG